MILEGIVTSVSPSGEVNIAPMGPTVPAGYPETLERFQLRPFPTSTTFQNLREHPEGILHVTDDVLLVARAAIGRVDPPPAMKPATTVRGRILESSHRYFEFVIREIDESEQRVRMQAEVVASGRCREAFGLNRAKHAIVEAAIIATRTAFLPLDDIDSEFQKLEIIVDKTGGPDEKEAMALLQAFVESERQRQRK